MKRIGLFALLAIVFMGVASPLGTAAQLVAGRVADMTSLFMLLNGTPTAVGVLTSTGTSVNQGTTASTFTFTGGRCYEVTCDGAAVINIGSTASTDYTSANFGRAMSAGQGSYFCVRDADTSISLDTTGATVNCNVRRMQ